MTPQIDDITLTAYALGELSGAERAAVAAHLAGDATARRFVANVRSTASLLADELARESFGGLTDLQHAVIDDKLRDSMRISRLQPRKGRVSRASRWNRAVFAMSLAASVMIVCGVVSVLIPLVYHTNAVVTVQPKKSPGDVPPNDPTIHGNGPLKPAPAESNYVDSDELDPALNLRNFPHPDFKVAEGDNDDEANARPQQPIVVIPPSPVGPPMAKPDDNALAQAPKVSPDDVKPDDGPVSPADSVKPAKKPSDDRFANIPANAAAPGKTKENVGSSADGALPAGEQYAHLLENPFVNTKDDPWSQFSADVDTASYSNVRRFLAHGTLPPRDAVRIEEMLNYFPISGAKLPPGDRPLVLQVELGACPWGPQRRLARVCLQAREIASAARPPVNLVFVIDTSDSMRKEKTKLALLKQAIRQILPNLAVSDRVALIAYNHEAQVILPPTAADNKQLILDALTRLEFSGETTGGQGIEVAYKKAANSFLRSGVNRVILATDGNWNVGTTDRAAIAALAAQNAKANISLTVLGVGMENLKDDTLQKLATAGNGSYAYIDTLAEAKKVLNDQVSGALVIVARDVKVQVKFDPAAADSYRLIGYERRALSKDEMKSQSYPGGDLGAGQSVTALYEVIPTAAEAAGAKPAEMLTATATYRDAALSSRESLSAVGDDFATPLPRTSSEFRFAAAVAEFGLLLRDSDHKGNATYSSALDHAKESFFGPDESGYRHEFLKLIEKAQALAPRAGPEQ